MYQDNLFRELIIDNFAGGGGASTGIELALGQPVDIAKIETAFNDGMHDLYGYDTKKYGTTCNNGISENKLFQVLVDYAKLHFIYFCQSYEVKNEN